LNFDNEQLNIELDVIDAIKTLKEVQKDIPDKILSTIEDGLPQAIKGVDAVEKLIELYNKFTIETGYYPNFLLNPDNNLMHGIWCEVNMLRYDMLPKENIKEFKGMAIIFSDKYNEKNIIGRKEK
jgi:hypothetical protein